MTEIEIREVVLQATVYCGTPFVVEAMLVTERTINEMVEKGEYTRPKVYSNIGDMNFSCRLRGFWSLLNVSDGVFFSILVWS